jgi:hypothetical protein
MIKDEIVSGVAELVVWWLGTRRAKLVGMSHESMAVNPFLIPLILALEDTRSSDELAHLLLSGHFAIGHATGFGKLIDEKILPDVFGTTKLTSKFRAVPPWSASMFDEIDHLVTMPNGEVYLLSQKAGRWTIQLTMAVQLNRAFTELLRARDAGGIAFNGIVVGVFYGRNEELTDKYDILRGINRGKAHDVIDIRDDVQVYAGRRFWSWLNENEDATQEWVLEGILRGIEVSNRTHGPISESLDAYEAELSRHYAKYIASDGRIDWFGILRAING